MKDELQQAESTFWSTMKSIAAEVETWPDWMKAYRIDIYQEPNPDRRVAPPLNREQ